MYKPHTTCRACRSPDLQPVFDLGIMPLANDFKKPGEECAGYAPLKVLFCPKCTLAQLSVVVDPKILYSKDYAYVTSASKTMLAHFETLWNLVSAQGATQKIIEIGSNDGGFLEFAKKHGAERVVGIDPAENLMPVAHAKGVRTVVGILDHHTADCASRILNDPDAIFARHVFCHADDWVKFITCLDSMMTRDTLAVIEVPYAVETLARVEFDQIYHEHLSYLTVKAMAALLADSPVKMQQVDRFTIHGGSIAISLRRKDWKGSPDPTVETAISQESVSLDTWSRFAGRAKDEVEDLRTVVQANCLSGKKVVGFGASAKSTVWISACGFHKSELCGIFDNTPNKHGTLSPGTDIPILPEPWLTNDNANVAVCFAWNFLPEIKRNHADWVSKGGKFINPHSALLT